MSKCIHMTEGHRWKNVWRRKLLGLVGEHLASASKTLRPRIVAEVMHSRRFREHQIVKERRDSVVLGRHRGGGAARCHPTAENIHAVKQR